MKKTICMITAICIIFALCIVPTLTYTYYSGATVTVIHCGYNCEWEIDPRQPLAVVQIETSAPIQHRAWAAIRLPGETDWEEDVGDKGYTSSLTYSRIAYGYPSGLETDYGAEYAWN